MPFSTEITKLVDSDHQHKSIAELAKAPVGALAGLSYEDSRMLADVLDARSITDFATSRFVMWAQAITTLAKWDKSTEYNPALFELLDEKWRKKPVRELAKASPEVLAGLSPKEAKTLAENFQIRTIEDLAQHRFVLMAQAIAQLAQYDRIVPMRKAA